MLNKKLLMVVMGSLALSACGKNNYNGTYTGYETSAASAAQTTNTGMQQGGYYPQQNMGGGTGIVTLTLKQDGDIVSGTYATQVSNSGYNTGYGNAGSSNGSGTFSASSQKSNSLDNVQLAITYGSVTGSAGSYSPYGNTGGTTCILSGNLQSSNDGKSLSGTLNMIGGGQQYSPYGSACSSKTLMLNRTTN